jgi:uncharacterized protein
MQARSNDFQVLVVPGLHNSGAGHWQTVWEEAHPGWVRVTQDDWSQPDLLAWTARLEAVRRRDPRPALLVAHSFGCLASARAMAQAPTAYAGALLVAPADPRKFGVADLLPHTPLGVPAVLVSSANDPWMRPEDAAAWARRWGAELVEAGPLGHINAESGLGTWPDGERQLHRVVELAQNKGLAVSFSA